MKWNWKLWYESRPCLSTCIPFSFLFIYFFEGQQKSKVYKASWVGKQMILVYFNTGNVSCHFIIIYFTFLCVKPMSLLYPLCAPLVSMPYLGMTRKPMQRHFCGNRKLFPLLLFCITCWSDFSAIFIPSCAVLIYHGFSFSMKIGKDGMWEMDPLE